MNSVATVEAVEVIETEPEIALEVPEKERSRARHFIDPKLARELLSDLLEPSPLIYWSDFIASLCVAGSAAAFAFAASPLSLAWLSACMVSSLAFYRLLTFSHELAHLRTGAVPGFKVAWNILVGAALLMPSIFYTGMHDDHHRTKSYGTEGDPEYRPFAGKRLEIVLFTLHSLLIYPILALRFFVLAPVGLIFPTFHRFLERKASSFTMNPRYERRMTAAERQELRLMEVAILLFWTGTVYALVCMQAEWKFVCVFMTIVQPIAIVNSLRTLAAHRYHSDGSARGKREQVLDSVDIPGAAYSALWAPAGLRFHALHHHFPTIPYHNLGAAYHCLIAAIPPENEYRKTYSPGLWSTLRRLWKTKPVDAAASHREFTR